MSRWRAAACGAGLSAILALAWSPGLLAQDDGQAEILERLRRLEANQARLEAELEAREARIGELESQLRVAEPPGAVVAPEERPKSNLEGLAIDWDEPGYFGEFQEGARGFKVADTPRGDLNVSAWAYVRYLNQKGLDGSYTDSFGRSFDIDDRHDVQLNKVNIYFKGWVFDPRLNYLFYVWTANTSQGDPAQVVVAGSMGYSFSESLSVYAGIGALPGTRSLRGTFPYWNKTDNRPIADEFFRPSYTTGIWAQGNLADDLKYKVMVGNNMSQLGVSAAELGDSFNTVSGSLWWMPTTGEFGPAGGYGDFEHHDRLATLFGINMTYSEEDRQSQPGTEDIQNTQLRLSDGTVIFRPGAFDTDGRINDATYFMTSVDAGMKYRGWALEGEYYFRWIDDFSVDGDIPEDDLFDHGFQLQASKMLLPRTLQGYVAGSYINGEYGKPWDLSLGANWYPFQRRLMRVNTELLYLNDSPVGYSSVPFVVGGEGLVFYSNLEIYF
jgi:hypothetical protein